MPVCKLASRNGESADQLDQQKGEFMNASNLHHSCIARIDILARGSMESGVEFKNISDCQAQLKMPEWFQEKGKGYVLYSVGPSITFTLVASADEELCFALRGKDVKDDNSERIPFIVDYTLFTIDGVHIFDEVKSVWHDEPFIWHMNAYKGQSIDIHLTWEHCGNIEQALTAEGDFFFSKKQFKNAVKYYVDIVRSNFNCQFSTIQKLRGCFERCNFNPEEISGILRACSVKSSHLSLKIRDFLFDLDYDSLYALHKELIGRNFKDEKEIDLWNSAFEKLLKAVKFDECSEGHGSAHPAQPKIAAVSGMGWSGSGAICSYLSEYDNVTILKGESTLLESSNGFRNIIRNVNGKKKFITAIIEFYFIQLLGIYPFLSIDTIKSIRCANNSRKLYMNNIDQLIDSFCNAICNYDALEKNILLRSIGNSILRLILGESVPDANHVYLLDNVIHLMNVFLLNYIDNIVMFCCFRDPRSNYAALKNEDKGFTKDANEFILWYKDRVDRFRNDISKIDSKSKVYEIKFEYFVMDSKYRESKVLEKIGNNLSSNKKYTKFKPWESFFNLLNYTQYADQREISIIYEALEEYSIDIKGNFDYIINILYECATENQRLHSILNKKKGRTTESNLGLRQWAKSFNQDQKAE